MPLGIIATRLLVVLLEFKHSSRVDEEIVQQHVLMRGPQAQGARRTCFKRSSKPLRDDVPVLMRWFLVLYQAE